MGGCQILRVKTLCAGGRLTGERVSIETGFDCYWSSPFKVLSFVTQMALDFDRAKGPAEQNSAQEQLLLSSGTGPI